MARTNPDLVKKILLKEYDTTNNPDLGPFIDTASTLVDDMVACAAEQGVTYGAVKLEIIERWVAAWVYHGGGDRRLKSHSTLSASATYETDLADLLKIPYALDKTGCLAGILEGNFIGVEWLGKAPSEQTDYIDRD